MFAYINLFSPKHTNIDVENLKHVLSYKGWGDGKISYSANDVLSNPSKYKDEMKRIKDANLKYPIILYDGDIVDGVHRLCKTILENKSRIKAFEFDKTLMKKFQIRKDGDWKKADQMKIHEFIEHFVKHFV
jgi:disulfide oxidoreductase YuzD